jgi:hypothetical protein
MLTTRTPKPKKGYTAPIACGFGGTILNTQKSMCPVVNPTKDPSKTSDGYASITRENLLYMTLK